ncbi:peptidylprolyl isomerase [Pseudooceanicola aestuarii]|uniref:peptidylprolyl isomerase n=1 Tax=Pseudooceanicola aestuarii TaxID=2697319 RepID=UPI0013D02BC8|nr:peptidylprolyl isomerase [Pseudooceanicola aestuarii]
MTRTAHNSILHRLAILPLMALALLMTAPQTLAQGMFGPVIKVNDSVITGYELDQRIRFLTLLRAPGNIPDLAREQLISDRIQIAAAARADVEPSEEDIQGGIREFAGRADMEPDQFIAALAQGGVEEQTLRDFIRSGVAWRAFVRARFGNSYTPSPADVDRARAGLTGDGNVRVLISEIFVPLSMGADRAQALAAEISGASSIEAFASYARRYSAAPTGQRGGKVNWIPLAQLPPQLRPVILGLGVGEVSQPIPVEGALALFQLRAIQEAASQQRAYDEIDYAMYYIAGGRSAPALSAAARLDAQIDTCDDLYGVAKGQPETVLERVSAKPAEIPADIGLELAKLDAGEVSTALTRNGGETLVFLMLCNRLPQGAGDIPADEIALQLKNGYLSSYADTYLAQLRAEARIIEVGG